MTISKLSLRGGEADEAIQRRAIRLATAAGAPPSETHATAVGIFGAGAGLLRRCAPRNDAATL
jgi:phosphate/sulfate permease